MKALLFPAALGLGAALAASDFSSTDYTRERTLRIESDVVLTTETTMEGTRDGESFEGRGGGASEEVRRVVQLERVLESADGRPTRVRREFETVEGSTSIDFGDMVRDRDHECPLSGVTLEISLEAEGGTRVEVVDGSEPDDDQVLTGHRLSLALDALLPTESVEEGATWDLEGAAVQRLLGLEVMHALFPPPSEERMGGGERDGERGGRRGRGRRRGGSAMAVMRKAEWNAEATLTSMDEEYEGRTCARIEIELESSGDLPEPEFGGRRRDLLARPATEARPASNTFEIELEGYLLFDLEAGRPLLFELEGTINSELNIERSSERGSMTMSITTEATYSRKVGVTEIEEDEE